MVQALLLRKEIAGTSYGFPKGTDFTTLTHAEVRNVVDELNPGPKKRRSIAELRARSSSRRHEKPVVVHCGGDACIFAKVFSQNRNGHIRKLYLLLTIANARVVIQFIYE